MKYIKIIFVLSIAVMTSCKDGPKEYLQSTQWVAYSYKINDIEWIDSTNAFIQLRYTFYQNGTMFRSSFAGTYNGNYFLDESNLKLLMMQEDTVQFQILTLNAVSLEMGGRKGIDSIYISAYH